MQKLISFMQISLDGYYADANSDMSWAKRDDPELNAFTESNASGDGMLVFGRITYQMMASFWPTPAATQMMPKVAEGMNRMQKIVFSRTLDNATWQNTRLLKGDLVDEIRKLKKEDGPGMAILGSGSIVSQLAQAKLIDELQVMVNPLALGSGKKLFDGVKDKLPLKLANSRVFKNGVVYLCYAPA